MSELLLYHQLESELATLPKNTIQMNGGYLRHYSKNPSQLIFGFLSLLSGIATGLLSIPSLMSLRNLDHDANDRAIFAQHPGLMIMGACSAIAQANFLMADFVRSHGKAYEQDHLSLSLLNETYSEFLGNLDLKHFDSKALNDDVFINSFEKQLHKIAHEKILLLIANKKKDLRQPVKDEIEWFADISYAEWRKQLSDRLKDLPEFSDTLYEKLDARIQFVWERYYAPMKVTIDDMLRDSDTAENNINQSMVGLIKNALKEFKEPKDAIFREQIVKLYEPLMHDEDGIYIEDQTIIKQSKSAGIFLSYLNVFVNVLIGLGAFFALGQFIFWLGGGSLAIFTAAGALGWSIKIAFAGLCAIGSYLVTRHDIQDAFNRLGYRLTLWLKSETKWKDLWASVKKPRNIFTLSATLPAAIGIGIINALGFYLAFQASPIVLALAVVVFCSTMVAIIAMMGRRLYNAYPRWCFYMSDLYEKRVPILINLVIVSAALSVFVMNAHYIPILFSFWAITPFSSFILIACAAIVLFAFLMTLSKQWRWQVSLQGSIGSICVFASIVAVFTALLPIAGPVFAAMIAISSSILFFSFYVSSVMVEETSERKYIVQEKFAKSSSLFNDAEKVSLLDEDVSDYEADVDVAPISLVSRYGE